MTVRELRAAKKRQERESRVRLRELERQRKEEAKLSALEQARLQVEMYEGEIEILLSIHKDRGPTWDWCRIAVSLDLHHPQRSTNAETKARISQLNPTSSQSPSPEVARRQDDALFQDAISIHVQEAETTNNLRNLARRVLAGDLKAYTEALLQFSPLTELSDLGSSIHFTVHSKFVIEAVLSVNGRQAIPSEMKSLTATGKLSTKAMPKGRFHEIYQDYICGCVLRVAREILAMLPVETVIVTALAETPPLPGTKERDQPVLSVAISRHEIATIDFASLDPSDTLETFLHHGDAKTSRRSGEFSPVIPLLPTDLPRKTQDLSLLELIAHSRSLRQQFTITQKVRP